MMPQHKNLIWAGILLALLIGGVYFIVSKDEVISPGGPNGNASSTNAVFTGSHTSGFEGYFSTFNYSFPYDADMFAVSSSSSNTPAITLVETGTDREHTVQFMYNGAAGFASSQEAWEAKIPCDNCTKVDSPISIKNAKDMIAYQNNDALWIVFEQYPGYVFIKTEKPNDRVLDVFKNMTMYGEDVAGVDQTSLKLYFFNESLRAVNECTEVVEVTRLVPKTTAVASAALTELLKGPTAAELASGFTSNLPAGSKLNSITIVNGEARADFNAATESGGGSCSMAARVRQIEQTLKQFPTVQTVRLSIDGRTGDIFQP